jgi:hypothetical protein
VSYHDVVFCRVLTYFMIKSRIPSRTCHSELEQVVVAAESGACLHLAVQERRRRTGGAHFEILAAPPDLRALSSGSEPARETNIVACRGTQNQNSVYQNSIISGQAWRGEVGAHPHGDEAKIKSYP